MKNKKLFLISGILGLMMLQATVVSQNFVPTEFNKSDVPPETTAIVLQGTLDVSVGPNSVEAYYTEDLVTVCFYQNFGYVNIILMNDSGNTLYDNTVNTAVINTVYIPINGTSGDSYSLILIGLEGYLEGDF